MSVDPVPGALVLRGDRLLLRWSDGETVLRAVDLRAACRCADCRAAALSRRGQRPDVDVAVRLTGAAAVGQYAVQLLFSDGHDRGIYPWAMLRELALATEKSLV